jgi:hypothetical protein
MPVSRGRCHLERDDFSSNRHPALAYCWSMIFSENRSHFSGSYSSRALVGRLDLANPHGFVSHAADAPSGSGVPRR